MLTKTEMSYIFIACDLAYKNDLIEYEQWAPLRITFLWCHPYQLNNRPLSNLQDGLLYFQRYGFTVGESHKVGMLLDENTELNYDTYLHIVRTLKRMIWWKSVKIKIRRFFS